jgi:hypothetical protein
LKSSIVPLVLAFSFNMAGASDLWVGNVIVHNNHRGIQMDTPFEGQTFINNLAGYNDFSVTFEVYKRGVTDNPDSEIWKKIDAQAELVRDSNGKADSKTYIEVTGRNGNNAVYSLSLYKINPSTVVSVDPEMQNGQVMLTHINLIIDGERHVSIPMGYRYVP